MPYALDRYARETARLYGVLDRRLEGREYIAGAYSIADMACWPWVVTYKQQGFDLAGGYPRVRRWYDRCKDRPGMRRGFDVGRERRRALTEGPDPKAREALFGAPPEPAR